MSERDLNRTQEMAYSFRVPEWARGMPNPWKSEPERQPVEGSDPGDRAAFVALLDRWGVPYEAVGQDVRIERRESVDDDGVIGGYERFYCDWEFAEDGRFVRVSIWE